MTLSYGGTCREPLSSTAFAYDSNSVPVSVQVSSVPKTLSRYYYVYNGHGDVVA